jgi:hypothetical protein
MSLAHVCVLPLCPCLVRNWPFGSPGYTLLPLDCCPQMSRGTNPQKRQSRGFFLDTFWRIVAVTLCNIFLTALHFIWWRPVASALCLTLGVIFNAEIQHGWNSWSNLSRWQREFVILFVFKFLKVVVHSISYLAYRPQLPSAKNAAYNAKDVTVIIPSIDDFGAAFKRCVRSVIECNPAQIFIATVESKKKDAERACRDISKDLKVITVKEANKRAQFLEAVSFATTKVIISADDQVYWGKNFLRYALLLFNDAHVGLEQSSAWTVRTCRYSHSRTFSTTSP